MMTDGTENRARDNQTAEEPSGSFGRYLRSVRVQKGIRLEAISKETRISVEALQCIENEEVDRLPAEVFVKGFLRAYSKAVGADGDEAIRLFDAYQGSGPASARTRGSARVRGGRRSPAWTVAAVLTGFALILAALYLVPMFFSSNPPEGAQQAPAQGPAPEAAATRENADAQAGFSSPELSGRHLLNIEAVDDAHFKVIIDDGKSEEYTLKPGDRIELSARTRFNILLSDPAGVRLLFNGEPVRTPGRGGQAVNIVLP